MAKSHRNQDSAPETAQQAVAPAAPVAPPQPLLFDRVRSALEIIAKLREIFVVSEIPNAIHAVQAAITHKADFADKRSIAEKIRLCVEAARAVAAATSTPADDATLAAVASAVDSAEELEFYAGIIQAAAEWFGLGTSDANTDAAQSAVASAVHARNESRGCFTHGSTVQAIDIGKVRAIVELILQLIAMFR